MPLTPINSLHPSIPGILSNRKPSTSTKRVSFNIYEDPPTPTPTPRASRLDADIFAPINSNISNRRRTLGEQSKPASSKQGSRRDKGRVEKTKSRHSTGALVVPYTMMTRARKQEYNRKNKFEEVLEKVLFNLDEEQKVETTHGRKLPKNALLGAVFNEARAAQAENNPEGINAACKKMSFFLERGATSEQLSPTQGNFMSPEGVALGRTTMCTDAMVYGPKPMADLLKAAGAKHKGGDTEFEKGSKILQDSVWGSIDLFKDVNFPSRTRRLRCKQAKKS